MQAVPGAGNLESLKLENVRLFAETQRLLKETEQRDAELAVIARIQRGISVQLDIGSIIDLVGDELRGALPTAEMSIIGWDNARGVATPVYAFEHGRRLRGSSAWQPVPGDPFDRIVRERQTLVFGTREEQVAGGFAEAALGTGAALSVVGVAVVGIDRVVGVLRQQQCAPGPHRPLHKARRRRLSP